MKPVSIDAVADEPRLVPLEVPLANEREVLPRRRAEAGTERPAELAAAAKAVALGDFCQRTLIVLVRQHEPQSLAEPARQQHGANAAFRRQQPVKRRT